MSRLRVPDYLAGLGGLLLLVGVLAQGTPGVVDALLLLVALAAIAVPVVTAVNDDPAPSIKTDVLTAWVTLIAVIIAVIRALGGVGGSELVALVGAVGAFAGCWWAMRLEAAPDLRTPPAVEAMPTPPAT